MRKTNGVLTRETRLGTSHLHEFHESKLPFVLRIKFIRSKLSRFSAHVSGVAESRVLA